MIRWKVLDKKSMTDVLSHVRVSYVAGPDLTATGLTRMSIGT